MARLRQWHEDGHAIVQATFGVEFASLPPLQTLRELLDLHPKVKGGFPRKRATNRASINVGADANAEVRHLQGSTEPNGFIFDALMPDGEVERSITLQDKILAVRRADYDGWDKTWVEESRETFRLMLPILLQRSNMIAFSVEYHDRFVWEGARQEFRAAMLFREDSKLLTPNVFEVEDLWHSFHGYFEFPDKPHKHQLLTIAEVQMLPSRVAGLDEAVGLVADVNLTHRTLHGVEQPGGEPTPIADPGEVLGPDGDNGLLDAYMNEMHEKNKLDLCRLINDEMCGRIGLEPQK